MLDKCLKINPEQVWPLDNRALLKRYSFQGKVFPPPPIQHSKSLSSLPQSQSQALSSSLSMAPLPLQQQPVTQNHRKLERAKGGSVIRPRVTFSELTENINVIVEEHKKLSRRENVLSIKRNPKSILHVNNRHTSAISETDDTLTENNDSETETESHYKTLKDKDENYSYAYR